MRETLDVWRFLNLFVLACWIGLTAVTVQTAGRWSSARASTRVRFQRLLDAQQEAMSESQEIGKQALEAASQGKDMTKEIERSGDRHLARVQAANQAETDAFTFEQIQRKEFWWEFAAWAGITLLGSTVLARRGWK